MPRASRAGFCYHGLGVLHGLVAVRIPGSGRRVRQDPRGNTSGVDAQFRTRREQLAFRPRPSEGERDHPGVRAEPSPAAVRALTTARDTDHLWQLPATAP